MGQTLTYGVYLPDEGERNCYSGLANNWQILDDAVGAIAGKANASHTHGNITNDGAIGSTSGLPVITGNDGVLTTGTFGNTSGTFCEGNDSRLSDARTPVAHTHTKSGVTDLLSSNFIPSANNSYDLGSSSYQWNNLYAKNYFYNGTQWGLGQDNTWTGSNTFSSPFVMQQYSSANTHGYVIKAGFARGTAPSANTNLTFRWQDSNGVILGFLDYIATSARYAATLNVRTENNGSQISDSVQLETDLAGSYFNFRPSSNGNINLGSSSYQWKSIYSQTYYYNGTQWGLDQANTWTGDNTFSGTTKLLNDTPKLQFTNTSQTGNTAPSSNTLARIQFNGSTVDGFGNINCEFLATGENRLGYQIFDISKTKSNVIQQRANSTSTTTVFTCDYITPAITGETELGTSYRKWKTLNGVNPGALSLPSTTYTNIDTTGWSTTGSGNTYTPTLDGWVYVRITGGSGNYITIKRGGSSAGYPCDTREGTALSYIALTVPVSSGQSIIISINGTIEQCRFIPCLGNV